MLGQAWRTMKHALGNVHPRLAQVLADLATLKARQNKHTEAQQLLRRSIAVWRHMGAGSHPALLNALRMLMNLCSAQGMPKSGCMHALIGSNISRVLVVFEEGEPTSIHSACSNMLNHANMISVFLSLAA